MRIVVGLLFLLLWAIYAGQLVSVTDLTRAQRWGLQEQPGNVDPLFTRLEVWTARWDLATLWTLPVAGVLMVADHSWWPYVAMIGGAVFVDTGGREAAKVLALRESGVRWGSASERRLIGITYAAFAIIGLLAVATGLIEAL